MKKILPVSLLALFVFTSCGIGIPSAIKAKTKAKYNFCIMNETMNLDETFSLDSMVSSMNSDENNLKMYGYNPDSNSESKQVAVVMPLDPIPLDFSEYLESVDFSADGLSVKNEFEIPDCNVTQGQSIDISDVNEKINKLVTFKGTASSSSELTFLIENGDGGFDSIVYNSGSITVTSAQPDYTTATFILEDGTELDSYFYGGQAVFNIPEGAALTSKAKINFGVDYLPTDFIAVIDEDSQISKVVGLTVPTQQELEITQTTEMNFGDSIKTCVIGEGSVTLNVQSPEKWEGVAISLAGNLTGAISTAVTQGTTSLNGKSVDASEDLNFNGKVLLTLTNATITFDKNPVLNVNLEVKSIKEAVISVGDDFNLAPEMEPVSIPSQVTTMVDYVIWKKSGVAVSLDTNLDSANTIALKDVKCGFFGISKSNISLTAGGGEEQLYCKDDYQTEISDGSQIDFSATLDAFNYDSTEKTITLKNITTNTTYNVDINVTPKLDWYKIKINPSALESAGAMEGNINTGFDKSTLFGSLDSMIFGSGSAEHITDYITLDKLPMYLFCNIPDALDGMKFKGTISSYLAVTENDVTTKVAGSEKYHLGTADSAAEMPTVSNFSLSYSDDGNTLVTDVSDFGVEPWDFRDSIWNASSGSLCLDYKLSLSGNDSTELILVNPDHKDDADATDKVLTDGNNSIAITAVIPIDLRFNVTNELDIDLMEIIKNKTSGSGEDDEEEVNPEENDEIEDNEDLFNRTEAYDTSTYDKYLNLIQSIEVPYTCNELPFTVVSGDTPSLQIKLSEGKDGNNLIGKDNGTDYEELSLGEDTIVLNPSEVLSAYPLVADVKIVLSKGSLYIPQEMNFGIKIGLNVYTDGEITLAENASVAY